MDVPDTLPTGQYIIYALIDPTDGLVHYVGQTSQPKQRFALHLDTRHQWGAKAKWVRLLEEKGQKPLMQVLETVMGKRTALTREKAWIRHFQDQGMPLLNIKKGPRSTATGRTPLLREVILVGDTRIQPLDSEYVASLKNDERWQREDHILAVVADLLARYGYRKLTLDDIARAAGVGKGTLFLYWQDKDAIVLSAIWREKRRVNEDIARRIAADRAGGYFYRVLAHMILATLSNPLMTAIVRNPSDIFADGLELHNPAFLRELVADFDAYIAQLQQAGLVRSDIPASIGSSVLAVLNVGVILQSHQIGKEDTPSMAQLTEAISDMLRRWLEPEQLPRDTTVGKQLATEWWEKVKEVENQPQEQEDTPHGRNH